MLSKKVTTMQFYPLLLAFYSPVSLFAANLGQVGFDKILLPLGQSIVLCILIWLFCYLLTRRLEKSSLLTAIIQIGFFSYGHVYDLLEGKSLAGFVFGRHRFLLVIWVLILAILLVLVIRKKTISPYIAKYFFIFSTLVLLLPLSQISISLYNSQKAVLTTGGNAAPQSSENLTLGYKPDIYYIILDTYTRSDILKDEYGYDNSDFIKHLRSKGFYVADCAKANFNQTNLSLYLSLNMDYIADPSNFEVIALGRGIRDNAFRTELQKMGYQTVAFETGYNFSEWFNADYYFLPTSTALGTHSFLSNLGSFDIMFLRSTMLAPLVDEYIQEANFAEESYRRSVTLFTLDKLKEIPQIDGPKLVFVHLSMNHAPFVFDADGGPNPELAKIRSPKSENDAYYKGYRGTFPYTDQKIQETVDAILKNSKEPPVIILQGDHGPLSVRTIKHYEILNALYLPGVDTTDFYPTMSPINTFRIVLDKYFGKGLKILPDEAYYSHPGRSADRTPIACPAE